MYIIIFLSINLFLLYMCTFPNQLFSLRFFSNFGLAGKSKLLQFTIRLLKPFLTNDKSNNVMLFLFVNSTIISLYFLNIKPTPFIDFIKNILYSTTAACIFALIINMIQNERSKTSQSIFCCRDFRTLTERDNIVTEMLGIKVPLINHAGKRIITNIQIWEKEVEDRLLKKTCTSKQYIATSATINGLSVYRQGLPVIDFLFSVINDDRDFYIKMLTMELSMYPNLGEALFTASSKLQWLIDVVDGKIKADPYNFENSFAQAFCNYECMKLLLIRVYSKSIRNYSNDVYANTFDSLDFKNNSELMPFLLSEFKGTIFYIYSHLIKKVK